MHIVRRLLTRMSRKKLVIRKEIGPFKRVFGVVDCFTLSTSGVLGFEFYDIMRIFTTYGETAVYAYAFAAGMTFLPVLCYVELASIQPCMGGPYHYGYNTTMEFVAFLMGWLTLQAMMSYNAAMLKGASKILDEAFFNGIIEKGCREYIGFHFWQNYLAAYPDILSFVLAMIFSGITSAETGETKILNNILFMVNIVIISVLFVLFLGKMNLDLLLEPRDVPWGTLFRTFTATNSIFNGVVFLTLLGEETIEPEVTIPKAMIGSFLFSSFWLSTFPVVQSLQRHYLELNRYTPIRNIFKASNLESLDFLPMVGLSAAIYCSCYAHMLTAVRLVVAMSRDGMLVHAFSKLEHFNNMPVKPAFLCGLMAGSIALLGNISSIWACGNVANMTIILSGPIFLLHARYMNEIDHMKGKIYRKSSKEPKKYRYYVVWVLVFSTMLVAVSASKSSEIWFVTQKEAQRNYFPVLGVSSVTAAISLIYLGMEPQNKVTSKFQVWGVPYTLVFTIFTLTFLISLANNQAVYFTVAWVSLGVIYYFVIVSNQSKLEDLQI